MAYRIDVRTAARTLLLAAAMTTGAGLAASAHASIASASLAAAPAIAAVTETGATESSPRSGHRLTRPANRFNGSARAPGQQSGTTADR